MIHFLGLLPRLFTNTGLVLLPYRLLILMVWPKWVMFGQRMPNWTKGSDRSAWSNFINHLPPISDADRMTRDQVLLPRLRQGLHLVGHRGYVPFFVKSLPIPPSPEKATERVKYNDQQSSLKAFVLRVSGDSEVGASSQQESSTPSNFLISLFCNQCVFASAVMRKRCQLLGLLSPCRLRKHHFRLVGRPNAVSIPLRSTFGLLLPLFLGIFGY